jgi:exosortase/archaeosortase family protein
MALAELWVGAVVGVAGRRAASLEARWATELLRVLGEHRVAADSTTLLVWPVHGFTLLLTVTWSCSSVPVIAAVGGLLLVLSTGVWWRRLLAMALSAALILAVNVIRLASSSYAAAHGGRSSLLLWHDWVGTALTVVTGALALLLGFWLVSRPKPTGAVS